MRISLKKDEVLAIKEAIELWEMEKDADGTWSDETKTIYKSLMKVLDKIDLAKRKGK